MLSSALFAVSSAVSRDLALCVLEGFGVPLVSATPLPSPLFPFRQFVSFVLACFPVILASRFFKVSSI